MLQAKRTSTARQRAFKAKTTWRTAINSFLLLQALHQPTREESAKLDQRNCLDVTLNEEKLWTNRCELRGTARHCVSTTIQPADEVVLLAIILLFADVSPTHSKISAAREPLEKRNEAWTLDWKNTAWTPYLEIFLKTQKKTTLTNHAAQSRYAFNWNCAHVLHDVNSYHKHVFQNFVFNLKTNTVNDKSANFPAIYYNVLKDERNVSVTEHPWVCLPFFGAFVPVSLPTFTTQALHFIYSRIFLFVLCFIPYLHAI